jgi:hypothetical protein
MMLDGRRRTRSALRALVRVRRADNRRRRRRRAVRKPLRGRVRRSGTF